MSTSKPILSIVVPSYNSERFISSCLKSIKEETKDDVEFILIDGASTDGTMEVIERYEYLFSHVISEPDKGQSDAFNKGFNLARGKFLTWLNSDDILCKGALEKALPVLKETKKEWLAANCIYFDSEGKVIRCCRSGSFEHFAVKNGVLNVFGPSTFFTKKLYQEIGDFDESFHYSMDTEYWWRIVKSGRIYQRINTYFWGLRLHASAKTASTLLTGEFPPKMCEESKKIWKLYFPDVSSLRRKRNIFKVRLWRLLNLSYLKAGIATFFLRGKLLDSIKRSHLH